LPDCTPYSCHCHLKSHLFFERIKFMPSGIWCYFARFVVPDVLRAPLSSKQEVTQPITHCHITADMNPLQHNCKNLGHLATVLLLIHNVVMVWQIAYSVTQLRTWISLILTKVPKQNFGTFLYFKWEGGRKGEIKTTGCRQREWISGKWGGVREGRDIGDEDMNSNNFPQQTKPLFVLVTATWWGHLEILIKSYLLVGV